MPSAVAGGNCGTSVHGVMGDADSEPSGASAEAALLTVRGADAATGGVCTVALDAMGGHGGEPSHAVAVSAMDGDR